MTLLSFLFNPLMVFHPSLLSIASTKIASEEVKEIFDKDKDKD